jgi:hypothetical protein
MLSVVGPALPSVLLPQAATGSATLKATIAALIALDFSFTVLSWILGDDCFAGESRRRADPAGIARRLGSGRIWR